MISKIQLCIYDDKHALLSSYFVFTRVTGKLAVLLHIGYIGSQWQVIIIVKHNR